MKLNHVVVKVSEGQYVVVRINHVRISEGQSCQLKLVKVNHVVVRINHVRISEGQSCRS